MPLLSASYMNLVVNPLVVGCGAASCLVFACVPVRMKRREAEEKHIQHRQAGGSMNVN